MEADVLRYCDTTKIHGMTGEHENLIDREKFKTVVIDGKSTDYFVSNLANVKNKTTGKTLSKTQSRTGIGENVRVNDTVSLDLGDTRRQVQVKRLVAVAFVPNPYDKKVVIRKK